MMKKKTVRLISSIIAAILILAMVISIIAAGLVTAGATEKDDLKQQLNELEDQKSSIRKEIEDIAGQVDEVESVREALQNEISLTKQEIATVTDYINRLQTQIDEKTQQLGVAEQELLKKEELFATRVRTMYEHGGESSYLDVILNATSIANMLSRVDIVTDIMDYDKKVVAEYKAAKEDIRVRRDDLQRTQDEQKNYQENLGYKVDELASSEAQQAALQESLEAYRVEQESEYNRITGDMEEISNKIAEISRREAEEAARKAAEEAARKAAEEAAARQKASAKSSSSSSSSSSGSSDSSYSSYSSYDGTFVWPAPGNSSCSSAYGWRRHPIFGTRKFHAGEDIPAPSGAPIVAAASGTVTTAGWVSGYGNYTVINHGGGVMTAYGHQSAIQVSVGQQVSAGEQIGLVGSTGNSTGPHLHFEVYVNGATQDPKSYSYSGR